MARVQPAPRSMRVPDIRRGDQVLVLTGREAGKKGTVEHVVRNSQGFKKTVTKYGSAWRKVSPLAGVAVVVEGLNIAKRHTKPRQSAGANDRVPKMQQGGILEIAQPLPVSRVMLICSNCGKPTRIAHATLETGRRVRVCRQCGEQMEAKA